jgi:hypothetical protein
VEEATDGKLVVVARAIGRWRRMMGREGGRSSGRASSRRGGACSK